MQASGAWRCLRTQPPMHARAIPCACTHMGVCACLRAPATACSCTTPPPRAHPHARTQPARMPAQHAHIACAPPAFTVKIPGRIGPPNTFSRPSQRDIWALRGDTETCSSAGTFGARPTEMLAAHAACCQTAWLPTEIADVALHFYLPPYRALLGSAPSFFWQNPFRVPGKPFF